MRYFRRPLLTRLREVVRVRSYFTGDDGASENMARKAGCGCAASHAAAGASHPGLGPDDTRQAYSGRGRTWLADLLREGGVVTKTPFRSWRRPTKLLVNPATTTATAGHNLFSR